MSGGWVFFLLFLFCSAIGPECGRGRNRGNGGKWGGGRWICPCKAHPVRGGCALNALATRAAPEHTRAVASTVRGDLRLLQPPTLAPPIPLPSLGRWIHENETKSFHPAGPHPFSPQSRRSPLAVPFLHPASDFPCPHFSIPRFPSNTRRHPPPFLQKGARLGLEEVHGVVQGFRRVHRG